MNRFDCRQHLQCVNAAALSHLQLPGGWNWSCSNNLWVITHTWEMNKSNARRKYSIGCLPGSSLHSKTQKTCHSSSVMWNESVNFFVTFLGNNWNELFGHYLVMLPQQRVFFRWGVCQTSALSGLPDPRGSGSGRSKKISDSCRTLV